MSATGPLDQPAFTWLRDLLWPAAAPDVDVVARYAVLSRGDRPRLILPLDSRRAAATTLRRASADESARRRALRTVLATAARSGLLQPFLRHRFGSAAGEHPPVETHLAGVLGLPAVRLGITIGPPRPNRKPVLQIMNHAGVTVAYAKVGWNGLTRALVNQESAALASLDRSGLRRLVLPEVIHVGDWGDTRLLVLSAIEPPRSESIEDRDPTDEEIAELGSLRTARSAPLRSDPYWSGLHERANAIGGAVADEVSAGAETAATALGETPVTFTTFHGDWTPWNMVATDRHLRVWDWERATSTAPFPFDVLHYHTMRAWFRTDATLAVSLERGEGAAQHALTRSGLPADQAVPLATLYLAEMTLRYIENAIAGTDERLDDQVDEIRRTLRDRS